MELFNKIQFFNPFKKQKSEPEKIPSQVDLVPLFEEYHKGQKRIKKINFSYVRKDFPSGDVIYKDKRVNNDFRTFYCGYISGKVNAQSVNDLYFINR